MKSIGLSILAAFVLVLATVSAYWPGSSGGFILDDYATLGTLGDNGGITDVDAALRFAMSGRESFVGRPLARLTFTMNGQTWPPDPVPFKVTNIAIHAATALLLFALFYQLLRVINTPARQAGIVAFSGALLWALHPAQISTVLYIVQRMTELSTLFIAAGLICYLAGRKAVSDTPRRGYVLMTTGVVFFGLLSFLNKETGVLIAVLIGVLELTLLRALPRPAHWRYWAAPMLGVPLAVIVGYFLMVIVNHGSYYVKRDFGLYERLLTQARALMDYLGNLLFTVDTPAVQHDHFEVSTGLFTPFTTLPSVLVIVALLVLGWRLRTKLPMVSFAILWFFGAHVLESMVLPLELYFEHRNYIPTIGPALALAYYLYRLLAPRAKAAYPAAVALIAAVMFGGTWHYSDIWGDEKRLAEAWVNEAPQSVRRMVFKMSRHLTSGELQQAARTAAINYERHPDRLGVRIFYLATACIFNRLNKQEYLDAADAASSQPIDTETFPAVLRLFESVAKGHCKQISKRGLENLIKKLLTNPDMEQWQWIAPNAHRLIGEINSMLKDAPRMIAAFEKSYELQPSVDMALKVALRHFIIGSFEGAQHYLDEAKRLNDERKPWIPSQRDRIEMAQKRLSAAVQKRNAEN